VCGQSGIDFGVRVLTSEMIAGREVLEVGAQDVNGSLRPHIESLGPTRYVGADIEMGSGVDDIVDAGDLVSHYGPESFDLVVTTEMVEHTREWRLVMSNLKRVLRPGGHLLVTTRSPGFHYHGWPYDFWRYTQEDMRTIFSDLEVVAIEDDPEAPGVFMLARRPEVFTERSDQVDLFSMVTGRRERDVSDAQIRNFKILMTAKLRLGRARWRLGRLMRRPVAIVKRGRSAVWMHLPGSVRTFLKRRVFRRG
jgi:SAM-dependent methyltransferase